MEIRQLSPNEFLALLSEIPQPPKTLWAVGRLPDPDLKLLAVVGSRDYTSYGQQVVQTLLGQLAGQPIGIVSGLALGIDALAHEAALANQFYTLAVPGSGLDESVLYPATNRRLARRILEAGGGLLSELSPTTPAAKWTFPQRNRLMAGMCHATLLIEAGEKSGTLITARLATDYNREVLAVPGSIFSKTAKGVHQFIKLGATPVTTGADILEALQLEPIPTAGQTTTPTKLPPLETEIMKALSEPIERDTLIRSLKRPLPEVTAALMQLEMQGYIALSDGHYQALV